MLKFYIILFLLTLSVLFVGFNLDNQTNVSLIFLTLEKVPVFFLAMVFFVLGFVSALPFFVGSSGQRQKDKHPISKSHDEESKNHEVKSSAG